MTTTREKGRRGDEKACLGRNEFAGVERWDELGLRLGGDGARHPSSRGYVPSKRGKTRPTPDVWRGPKLHVYNWFDETHELTAVHLLIFLLHFQPPPQIFAQQVLNRCLFFPVNHQKAKKKKGLTEPPLLLPSFEGNWEAGGPWRGPGREDGSLLRPKNAERSPPPTPSSRARTPSARLHFQTGKRLWQMCVLALKYNVAFKIRGEKPPRKSGHFPHYHGLELLLKNPQGKKEQIQSVLHVITEAKYFDCQRLRNIDVMKQGCFLMR